MTGATRRTTRYEVIALPTSARVGPGDDLAVLLLEAARGAEVELRDGDVLCVASKVVSKSEDAFADLAPGDVHRARRRLAAQVARRVVAETPAVLVVETVHGFVCANAGIDTSNVSGPQALLLPDDPDRSAASLREAIADRAGVQVGVVITDTFGRPWRVGQTDVALGVSGVIAVRDDRGTTDLDGVPLEVTMIAVADEIAAAADLARGKADGTPFVLVRGSGLAGDGRAADLVRSGRDDVFRTGGPTTIEAAVLDTDTPPWPNADDWAATVAERAIVASAGPGFLDGGARDAAAVTDVTDDPPEGWEDAEVVLAYGSDGTPAGLMRVGRAAERARLVLRAHGLQVQLIDGDGAEDAYGASVDLVLVAARRPGEDV